MALPPLKVNIGANTEGLDQGVDQANRKLGTMTGTAQRVGKSIDRIGDRAKALGKQMTAITGAITAAAGGLLLLTKRSAESANEIGKAARTAGVNVEAFQELQFAIGQIANVSDSQFADAMQKLSRRMGLAADGQTSYMDALERVGVSQEEIQSGAVTTEEVMNRLNKAMSEMDSQAQATATASLLLGERQGPKIGAAMRENADAMDQARQSARDLGLVMSSDFIRQSESMVDQFDVLSRQMEILRADLAEKIIPLLVEDLIPAIQNKVIPAIEVWIEKIGEIVSWFQDLPAPVQEAIGVVAAALGASGPVLIALGVMAKAFAAIIAATGPIGLFIAAATIAAAAWAKWGDDIKAAVGSAIDFITDKFDALMDRIQGIIDRARAVKDAISDALSLGSDRRPTATQGRAGGAARAAATSSPEGAGQAMAEGLAQGLGQGLEDHEDEIRAYIKSLPEAARDELEIRSPSRVFDRIGRNIGDGLAGGIGATAEMTNRAVRAHTDTAQQTAADATSNILGSMSQLFQGSKPIAAAQALINTYQGITEALKLPFPASLAAAAKVAAQGFAAVQGIRGASPGGGGTASGGGGTAQAQQQQTPLEVRATFQGDFFTAGQVQQGVSDLFEQLEGEAQRRGLNLTVVA